MQLNRHKETTKVDELVEMIIETIRHVHFGWVGSGRLRVCQDAWIDRWP